MARRAALAFAALAFAALAAADTLLAATGHDRRRWLTKPCSLASAGDDAEDDVSMRHDPDEKPVLPEQSEEEAGIGWGEAPEPDDEERLRRDRPPHWDR